MIFLCMIILRAKTVAHTFFLCFNNANGRLYQERFLRSINFVTMVTLVALLFFISVSNWLNIYHLRCLVMTGCS